MLRSLRSLSLILAAAALVAAPAAADAKTAKKKKVAYPTVTSVAPLKLKVGDTLTIRGNNFKPGRGKTTVVFQRAGKPAIFVKSATSTRRVLTVQIPDNLGAFLVTTKDGSALPTTFKLRVLAAKFSRAWTSSKTSPTIAPKPVGATDGTTSTLTAYQQCQEDAQASPSADSDSDGLSNAVEKDAGTDPCKDDTDGDGVTDGYEYYSAIDLNGSALPYPGKRPWPNPLDNTDATDDFDGDGLTMAQEFKLWKAAGGTFPITAYSDGKQNTGGPQPVTTLAQSYLDLDGDGNLTDDERDFDGDGLSNVVEFSYTGTQNWWKLFDWHYAPHSTKTSYVEPWYTIRAFSDVDPTNPDTDGDGIPDGQDDQDNDGWNNFIEMQLGRWRTGFRVHPFNPCLPNPHALTCSRWIPIGATPWPPYDKVDDTHTSQQAGDATPFVWNGPGVGRNTPWVDPVTHLYLPATWWSGTFTTGTWDGLSGPQGPSQG